MRTEAHPVRVLGVVILLVLSLRLLAWTAPADSALAGSRLNQTIPTRTPTPPPQTPQTPPPTSPARRTPTPLPGTPDPTGSPAPLPTGRTPQATTETTETPLPAGPTTVVSPVTAPPTGLSESTATAEGPDAAAVTPGTARPAEASSDVLAPAVEQTPAALPRWTPAVTGRAAAGGLGCAWPAAGLLLVVLGAMLLAWSGRRSGKGREDGREG